MRDIRTRRTVILILTFLAIAMAIGIYTIVPSGVAAVEILNGEGERINEELNIYSGSEVQLVCKVSPAIFEERTTTYLSADENIATVDNTGLIKGLKKGEALVTIHKAGARHSIKVKVQPGVKAIKGLPDEITLYEGDGYTLKPKVEMFSKKLEVPEVTYKSKRNTIVTIDADGYMLAGETGSTRITVQAGPIKEEVHVTVIERPVPNY